MQDILVHEYFGIGVPIIAKAPSGVLNDFVVSTPRDEGKWFAATKWAGVRPGELFYPPLIPGAGRKEV